MEKEQKEKLQGAIVTALLTWQASPVPEKANELRKLIEQAGRENAGFVLKVNKSLLENTGPLSKAFATPDFVQKYTKTEGEELVITIPKVRKEPLWNMLKLSINLETNYLVVSSHKEGAIGYFLPSEITSLTIS